ncbi:hypothetical protein ACFUJR_38865, partial [Streptomyces sp. NPDC057271]|uniref:hypothetical protein n=1 Tax=Streptomyces sp. NPDC057271 TaxID=3346078 RepID=UPI0036397F69
REAVARGDDLDTVIAGLRMRVGVPDAVDVDPVAVDGLLGEGGEEFLGAMEWSDEGLEEFARFLEGTERVGGVEVGSEDTSDPVVIVPDVELPEGTGELNLDQLAEAEAEAVPVSVPRAENAEAPESVVPAPPNVGETRLSFEQAVAEGSPVGQWADYAVARVLHDRKNGVAMMMSKISSSLGIEGKWREQAFVLGVLEASGVLAPYPMRVGATYDQMRRAVGLVAGKLKASGPLDLVSVAGTVLGNRHQQHWRVLGWATGAMLLHPLADGARQRLKDEVVELGRQARDLGQVPDVEGIVRRVFGVEATIKVTEHQKFLVSGWLSGEEVPWEPVAGTETALEVEASTALFDEGFPRTDQIGEAEADPVSVPRAESVVMPEWVVPVPPNAADPRLTLARAVAEGSPVGQWADYIVASAVHDRRTGVPLAVAEILRSLRIRQKWNESRFVLGVLEAAGVLAPYPMREGATYGQMIRAVGLVAGKLVAGESISPWQVAGTVLGAKSQSAGAWRVLGWVTGAMLLHPVRGGARQRMRDEVVELGRQARLLGQVPDVEGIVRRVFGVEATTEVTEHQKFLVVGWLSGEEGLWHSVAGLEVTPELDRFADEVVTHALSQLALGRTADISGMEGVAGQGESMFGVGVLEWMGLATPGGRMRRGATYQEMLRIVLSARRDKAEGRSVDARRYETTAVAGSGEWARRVARIKGWLTAAGVVGSRPVNGSRQALIDKARGLAAAAGVAGNGGYDVPSFAREVFEAQMAVDHQVYVVREWIGAGNNQTLTPILEHLLYAAMPLSDIAYRLGMGDDEDRAHRFLLEQSARYRTDFDTALAEILGNALVRDRDVDAKLGDFAARKGLRVETVKLWRNHHDDVLLLRRGLRDLSKQEWEELRSRAMSRLTQPADEERSGAIALLAEERLLRAMWDLREEENARMMEMDMDVVASVPGDESAFAVPESQHEDNTAPPVVGADHVDDVMSLDEEISDTQESTVPVSSDAHARVARVLAEYKQRPEAPASELVGVAYPGVTEPSLDQVMRTVGFLEAVGAPSIGEVAPIEMVVAVAMMRSRTDSGEEGWTVDEVVEEVLGAERNVDGESSRLLGWFEAARYLDGSDGPSVYSVFVERVVQTGRDLRGADGRVDVREVARLSFAVREPSATQMAAVRYWLAQHGMSVTVDQGESAGAVKGASTHTRGPVVAVIASLLDGLPEPARPLDESVSLRERAEYVVHRTVLAVTAGQRFVPLEALAAEVFGVGHSTYEWGMVAGFVQGAGLGSLLHQNATDTSQHMAGVFAAARRSLEEGKPVDPLAITTSILGRAPHNHDRYLWGTVTGWLTVAGLMGGPVVKDGVIERIKGALTGA